MPQSPAARGVYLSPGHGREGEQFFVAVDHDGVRIFEAVIYGGNDSEPFEDALWNLLDHYDPPNRRLHVVH